MYDILSTRQRPMPLTARQQRISEWAKRPAALESLADRSRPIPPEINLEQLLGDLSDVYLGMSDAAWPLR